MNELHLKTGELIFATSVQEHEDEEFHVDFFHFQPDYDCEGIPLKTIHNFDELIDFLEMMDQR
ncbi:hypothetical protein CU633_04980 [Bacillus sp. V3-13]|uniref:hypothetical protein n=1 Tax=Bacillus sp. V3-13 TaxID=2053728 RepID=UPI000C794667|nr:hypothetical protein [Bacillus sp. V3-13]PLR78584.1 hypothetical protein CU633_04980 [Bacillus sp. V3-13]